MKIALYCPNKPLSHPNPSGDLTIAKDLQNVLNEAGFFCREIFEFRTRWFWKSMAGWRRAAPSFLEAYREVRKFRPNLWLSYHSYYKSPDILGPWISRMVGIPYVLFQPMYSTRRRKHADSRPGFYLNRVALKAADHVFINNFNDLESLRRIFPPHKITYIPPGIQTDAFQPVHNASLIIRKRYEIDERVPLLLTAARLRTGVKSRSIEYLFRSLSLINTDICDYRLLVLGDGPMEENLKSLAQQILPGRVVFASRIPRDSMATYYSAADIFVFPGIGESLGMVYLEAQACAVPVVAIFSPGVAQVVLDGKTGLLVPEDHGQAMASAIRNLLMDPQRRRMMGEQGFMFVRQKRNSRENFLLLACKLREILDRHSAERSLEHRLPTGLG